MPKRVLVTGGAGLIGFHAAKLYEAQGDEVVVMDNLERSDLLGHSVTSERMMFNVDALGQNIQWWDLDVSDQNSWRGVGKFDTILHFAGQCGVPTSIASPRRDWEVNANGTLNVLEYAREHGSTVCLASTNKVYPLHTGWVRQDDRWVFENQVWRKHGFPTVPSLIGARTPYGNSKMAADLLCQEWAHTYGIKTGIFRMSCIYGPNQMGFEEQGWATYFVICCLKGWPITIFGDGHQTRDMLYVEDCVRAYEAFAESDLKHGVFNLGGGPSNTMTLL